MTFEFGVTKLPNYEVPKGYTPWSYLKELCEEGLHKRYPVFRGEEDAHCKLSKEELEERLDYELNTIKAVSYTHLDVYKRQDYIIDTSNLLVRDLRAEIEKIFVMNRDYRNLFVTIMSFGFKSVSYTHLDVYKRQEICQQRRVRRKCSKGHRVFRGKLS